ncbi:hypothetical protein SNE40_010694 [Patella caerulea]|uniref:Polycystin cation channel PKD1/PKD2 domain-containing protein n=1 Tax=Patella caerulea TaxID=87958 RepID=A0AAN8Q5C4_PATCE
MSTEQLIMKDAQTAEKTRREMKFEIMDAEINFKKLKDDENCDILKCVIFIIFFIKLALVTAQVINFATLRSGRAEYLKGNELAFKHLFLEDWSASYETMPYPPAEGDYAVYTKQGFYDHLNYIISQYYKLPTVTIGTFKWDTKNMSQSQPPLINLCEKHFKTVKIFENDTYIIDSSILTECFDIKVAKEPNGTIIPDVKDYLDSVNHTILFRRLISVNMNMLFKCYHIDTSYLYHNPDCFNTAVNVWFDNGQTDGKMKVGLNVKRSEYSCKETNPKDHAVLDGSVIVFVCVSIFAYICFEYAVCKKTNKKLDENNKITRREMLYFANPWIIITSVGDTCVLIGSALKIELDTAGYVQVPSKDYDACSMCIGIGFFLVWFGFIRDLKYLPIQLVFKRKINMLTILVSTLKDAVPDAIVFLVCVLFLFVGFMLCGWVALGPYNIKFRSISSSSECLFSLMNGDEIYVTLQATQDNDCPAIWYFSRCYLYLFCLLFICLVLNLFTAIFLHAYEILKRQDQKKNESRQPGSSYGSINE